MLARVTPPVGMKRSAPGEESVTGSRGERGRAESEHGHDEWSASARGAAQAQYHGVAQ